MKIVLLLLIVLTSINPAFPNNFLNSSHTLILSDQIEDENNIREAVFRFQFQHIAFKDKTIIYFLSVYGKDPDEKFMKRFGNNPRIRKQSQAINGVDGIVDKKTGEVGLILQLYGIKWLNKNEVEISGGYYEAMLSASGNTYSLKRTKRGKWIITKDDLEWIS